MWKVPVTFWTRRSWIAFTSSSVSVRSSAWKRSRQARLERPSGKRNTSNSTSCRNSGPASCRSAAASRQSEPVESREALEAAVAAQPEEPPRPGSWGGYRLVPESYEFWEHRENRLHDRIRYTRAREGWRSELLSP